MAISVSREYLRATVVKSQDGLTDVVQSIYCNATATDGDYIAILGKEFSLSPPDPQQFVPFNDLTKTIIDSWVTPTEEYLQLEQNLTNMIEEQKNPPVVVLPLPFSE